MSDLIPQQVWTARPDGSLDFVNTRIISYFGRTHDEMVGWGWQELIHPDDLPLTMQRWMHSLSTGEKYENEFRLWHAASGEYRWHLSQAVPERDERSAIQKWFGTNTDISERKRAEEERDQALERARRANDAKDRFLALLSHELRTPLNPVLMAAAAIETDPNLPFDFRADITMIRRNVELEARLIDDLLDFTRIANGKLELRLSSVNAHDLVERATNIVRGDPDLIPARIVLQLAADHFSVHGDPARFQQIVWNLVKNAVKFTPPEGTIDIRTSNPEPGVWRLTVKDTGCGIPKDRQPFIFDAFDQGDEETFHKFGGLGLGLAISKAVAEMHGGKLTAESEGVGRGALFTLDLPLDPNPKKSGPVQTPAAVFDAKSLRILVVEDHESSGRLVVRLLERRGHQPSLAQTVAEALDLAAAARFDIVISDLGLPDGSGFDLMSILRDRFGLSGIALSGYGTERDVTKGKDVGFVAHLTKPVDIERLLLTLEGCTLDLRQSSSAAWGNG